MQLASTHHSGTELARSLAKLWPHRSHESSVWKSILCRLGLHRWAKLDLTTLAPDRDIAFCRWCDTITIDKEKFRS